MPWKLILQLSLFGLAMGVATVFWIPSNVEPFCWPVIFLICAFLIGRSGTSHPFYTGALLGLANSVWITACHIIFFDAYIANHEREAAMVKSVPVPPRFMMMMTGPFVGIVSGIVIGVLAWITWKVLKPRRALSSS